MKLLNELIGGKVQPMTMEIMTDLVSRSWSRAYDIDNAAEDFAVDAMMYQADKDGVTLRVSIELAELQSALLNLPVVRADLSNTDSPIQARYDLLHALIGNEDFNKITVRIATHSTRNPRLSPDDPVAHQQILPAYGRIDGHSDHRGAADRRAV